ncbi:hypothetical protein KAJ87_01055 [Candidatus Pacearchaeota archaeon]|nr:hypothetical protein [Candidatus Pacearchaeota archaeon]
MKPLLKWGLILGGIFIFILFCIIIVCSVKPNYINYDKTLSEELKSYRLFYSKDPFSSGKQGLYQIDSNGENEKLLFKSKVDSFKLDFLKRKIGINSEGGFYEIDENGEFVTKLFQGKGKISSYKYSPDGKYLFIVSSEIDNNEDLEIDGLDEPFFHLINLDNLNVLELKNNYNFKNAVGLLQYWHNTSEDILIIGTRVYSNNDVRRECFKYNLRSESSELLKTGNAMRSEVKFIDGCVGNSSVDRGYDPENNYALSPDKEKEIIHDYGKIIMNVSGDIIKILDWIFYDHKFNSGYSLIRWLPDSRQILVKEGRNNLYIVDTETKKWKKVANAWGVKMFESKKK